MKTINQYDVAVVRSPLERVDNRKNLNFGVLGCILVYSGVLWQPISRGHARYPACRTGRRIRLNHRKSVSFGVIRCNLVSIRSLIQIPNNANLPPMSAGLSDTVGV